MNQRALVIAVALFVLIVLGMFVFTEIKRSELWQQKNGITEPTTKEALLSQVSAKHYFDAGTSRHTLAGEVELPTPCDVLETNAIVRESFPEQVVVAFNVTREGDACAQVLTPQRFKVSFPASAAASISATFDDEPIRFDLTPAEEGEDPADFELITDE